MPKLPELIHDALRLLSDVLINKRYGEIVGVSSFGAESAVLLHLIAQIDKKTPIFFIDTHMLFQETLDYKTELTRALELTHVKTISPDPKTIRSRDMWGNLHLENAESCCQFRKTSILKTALEPFAGWITGRKRFQSATRTNLKSVEKTPDGKTKINPLVNWNQEQLENYMDHFDLPRHKLVAQGYKSIGCASCTSPVKAHEDARAGRWRSLNKTECGIHFDNGKIVKESAHHVR